MRKDIHMMNMRENIYKSIHKNSHKKSCKGIHRNICKKILCGMLCCLLLPVLGGCGIASKETQALEVQVQEAEDEEADLTDAARESGEADETDDVTRKSGEADETDNVTRKSGESDAAAETKGDGKSDAAAGTKESGKSDTTAGMKESGKSDTTAGTKESGESQKAAGLPDDVEVNEKDLDELRKRGHLTVGCKMDVPGLSFYDEKTDTWSGLEVELAYHTAANVFEVSVEEAKEQELVEFVGVTVADREKMLEDGKVDCMFATYTITDERAERFGLSDSYYTDYIGLMVKTSGNNPNSLGTGEIRSIANLDGKYIGVPRNATTRTTVMNYINIMNSLKSTPIFCEYESYEVLFKALQDGNIDVMAVDVSILNGYADSTTMILNDRFGSQHYGGAVRKENGALLMKMNEAIASLEVDEMVQ